MGACQNLVLYYKDGYRGGERASGAPFVLFKSEVVFFLFPCNFITRDLSSQKFRRGIFRDTNERLSNLGLPNSVLTSAFRNQSREIISVIR